MLKCQNHSVSSRQRSSALLDLEARTRLLWPLLHQSRQTQILPSRLLGFLSSSLYSKRRMLIRDYVVLIFGVDGLVMRWNVDLVIWELVLAEIFEQVCVSRAIEVDIGMVRVFRLELRISAMKMCDPRNSTTIVKG